MRVLDLGAHDGYLAAYVAAEGAAAHVDGVELNAAAVEVMNRRLADAGVSGRCVQGLAEQAPELFEPGTYDAVVLYEILEHVPDVDRLLDAAEAMLKPGGRVYVSTPDGTFGEGNNPHHLRALRAIDLADLCRRRGTLHNLIPGPDGVAVCSYEPRPRHGDVAIYVGPGWEKWGAMDMLRKGLGGSETAACRLAEALSNAGWVVTVYGECDPAAFRDVLYRPWQAFDPLQPVDLLISSRTPELFDRPHRAGTACLWLHDIDCGDRLTPARARSIDFVLTLSRFHEAHVRGRYPFLNGKLRRVTNGCDRARFRPAEPPERTPTVVYSSSPDRGLDTLLELIWPKVLALVPDAQLRATYAPVYSKVAAVDPAVRAQHERTVALADQPGVELLPAHSQPQLAQLMLGARVWVAPSYNTTFGVPFHETSCIGAMEAQLAGLHVVASNWGALPETVRCGALVDGPPLSEQWVESFAREIARGLTNEKLQRWAETQAPGAIPDLTWEQVAADVVTLAAPALAAAA